jgi:hypothetical protein
MYGVKRTGVRLVLSNTADPARADDTTAWYNTYAAAITHPSLLVNAHRFENVTAAGTATDPRYAEIYDIATPDPADAWPATQALPDYPTSLFDDPRSQLVVPELRGSWALVGTRERPGDQGPLTGIYVVGSNGADDTARAKRATELMRTGIFYVATRFRLIEGFPEATQWLEIFETDAADPVAAMRTATASPAAQPDPAVKQRFACLFLPTEKAELSVSQ